jgi:hypothetical protein
MGEPVIPDTPKDTWRDRLGPELARLDAALATQTLDELDEEAAETLLRKAKYLTGRPPRSVGSEAYDEREVAAIARVLAYFLDSYYDSDEG